MSDKTLIDFLPEIMAEIQNQLESDQKRWGDTWKHRSIVGQEERTYQRYMDYWDQFHNANTPIPWAKVIGEAIICMVRDKHPEEMHDHHQWTPVSEPPTETIRCETLGYNPEIPDLKWIEEDYYYPKYQKFAAERPSRVIISWRPWPKTYPNSD